MQDVKVYWRKFWFAVIILQKQYVINTILTHSVASDFPISLTLFFPLIIKNHLITNLEKPANKGQSLESRYNDQQGLTRERQHQQTTKSLSSNYWCYNNKILNTVFHPHIFKIKGSAMKFHKSLKNQTNKKKGNKTVVEKLGFLLIPTFKKIKTILGRVTFLFFAFYKLTCSTCKQVHIILKLTVKIKTTPC